MFFNAVVFTTKQYFFPTTFHYAFTNKKDLESGLFSNVTQDRRFRLKASENVHDFVSLVELQIVASVSHFNNFLEVNINF